MSPLQINGLFLYDRDLRHERVVKGVVLINVHTE